MNINSTTPSYNSSIFQQQAVQKSGGQPVGPSAQPVQQAQQTQQVQQPPSEEQQESMLTQSIEGSQGEQTETQSRINIYA